MSNLTSRVLSAVVAIGLLAAVTYFFERDGLRCFCLVICAIGVFEYAQLTLKPLSSSEIPTVAFLSFGLLNLTVGTLFSAFFYAVFPVLCCTFIAALIWLTRNKFENEAILKIIIFSLCGFFYTGLLPAMAIQLFDTGRDWQWFLLLLATVFAGDIFAYFGGKLIGGPKLMPGLSPKKTIAGAVSGLLGSMLAGLCVNQWTGMNVDLIPLVILLILAAGLAQNGDLFKSLVKRVAQVKDSGNIMPGHGGVLDRLDGVYFAAPIMYLASRYLSH